jgi:hypothetical protein
MTSEWCSQILDITQAMASLTLALGSLNMVIKLDRPGIITFMNWILSGPSVIAPKERRAEYLYFQSCD